MCAHTIIMFEVFLVAILRYIEIVLKEQMEPNFQVGILV